MIYKGYFSMSLVDAVLNYYISLQADSPGSLISHQTMLVDKNALLFSDDHFPKAIPLIGIVRMQQQLAQFLLLTSCMWYVHYWI